MLTFSGGTEGILQKVSHLKIEAIFYSICKLQLFVRACLDASADLFKFCSLHIQQGLFTGMFNLKMIAKDK